MNQKPTYEQLEQRVWELEKKSRELETATSRIRHLNAVLSSIRDLHRFITKEKNRDNLLRISCEILASKRGYHNAWIALIKEKTIVFSSGNPGDLENLMPLIEHIQSGKFIDCSKQVFLSEDILSVEDPNSSCKNCPVSKLYGGRGAMSARLEHNGTLYGILTVSVPPKYATDPEEQQLFKDAADDIAFALYSLEANEQRERVERELRQARDELEHRVRTRTRELELLSSKLFNAQEEERKRIAADLHDGIGQFLSAIKFIVENIIDHHTANPDTIDINSLKNLIPMLQDASEEVRSIVMNLRPSILDDLGILATIAWFCRQFRMIYTTVTLNEHIHIQESDIPDELKIILFRVLQEAINNMVKYSHADAVNLVLKKEDSAIVLEIADNGRGFDLEKAKAKSSICKGFGITGMKERTELSGGTFTIETAPGQGCVVRASWNYGDIKPIF